MQYVMTGDDFNHFVSVAGKQNADNNSDINSMKVITPKGDAHFRKQTLDSNLFILEADYLMNGDVTILGKGTSPLLEIQCNLSAMPIVYHDDANVEHTVATMSSNIAFLPAEQNEAKIHLSENVNYNTFDIHLPLSMLDGYAGESGIMDNFLAKIHKNISGKLSPSDIGISADIFNVIQDIKSCTYEGLVRRIYFESKTYELIALLYNNAENKKEDYMLNAVDKDKIHWAASLIKANLDRPCTIIELAHQVGINQTKLKAGFKILFDNTVFGYMQDLRMHQAKKYLMDTNMSIQEIGMNLGYQNTSNFSIAFKKTHGISPMKAREIYTKKQPG
ncbi:hypothetical protein A9P82_01710 [Arachidicoccus ginsenosidimutans]|nr:hypothetical protein A9P82_01710 [Arachidicoccus sp. BS20]